jgi:hypothetical protein
MRLPQAFANVTAVLASGWIEPSDFVASCEYCRCGMVAGHCPICDAGLCEKCFAKADCVCLEERVFVVDQRH